MLICTHSVKPQYVPNGTVMTVWIKNRIAYVQIPIQNPVISTPSLPFLVSFIEEDVVLELGYSIRAKGI